MSPAKQLPRFLSSSCMRLSRRAPKRSRQGGSETSIISMLWPVGDAFLSIPSSLSMTGTLNKNYITTTRTLLSILHIAVNIPLPPSLLPMDYTANSSAQESSTSASALVLDSQTTSDPFRDLKNTAHLESYSLGTGRQLLKHLLHLITHPKTAPKHSLIFVTCFWAPSASRLAIHDALIELSRLHIYRNQRRIERGLEALPRIKVRICFSALPGISQRLFHTNKKSGRIWSEKDFHKLGLPQKEETPGLDVQVKSVFYRPVSVWHQKFGLIDSEYGGWGWVGSMNVSWEG